MKRLASDTCWEVFVDVVRCAAAEAVAVSKCPVALSASDVRSARDGNVWCRAQSGYAATVMNLKASELLVSHHY